MEDTSIAIDPEVAVASSSLSPSTGSPNEFRATDGYRRYVIWLLFTIYVFNFADRSILAVLVQPIKAEFGLSDAQLGLLGGLAFALLYTTLGIPIARLADRSNRVNIIAVSLFAWSLFTGLTGFARSFLQLLAARLAVGIGEAGCSPAAYSLIGDYFDKKRRATAAATYAMGISGGVFVGFVVATRIAHAFGWRAAFFAVGFPGMLLSIVVKLTLREPPRGFSDGLSVPAEQPPLGELLKKLWAKRAFRNLSIGAALSAFVAYGAGAFYPAFLMRTYGLSMMEVGARLGIVTALGGFIGSFVGGRLTDMFGNRSDDPRFQLWVPATALLINVPLGFLIYHVHSIGAVLALLLVLLSIGAMPLGPTYAAAQSLLLPRERALGAAVVLFVVNLVGLGFGPLATGFLSDAFHTHLLGAGQSDAEATAGGLVWALQAMIVVNLWAAAHFFLGARTLRADSVV